jgi:hypothetical protein
MPSELLSGAHVRSNYSSLLFQVSIKGAQVTTQAGSWQPPPDPPWRTRNFTAEAEEIFAHHQGGMARSLQREIGPSEIGHPCDLHLVYKLGHVPPVNVEGLKWAAWLGTAAHRAAEEAMHLWNEHLGRERYLIEHETEIDAASGVPKAHTDVYDTEDFEVIDWKFPGAYVLDKAKASGEPGPIYKVQGHTYGLGWVKRGFRVDSIRIVMLPRGTNNIREGFEWAMPYNANIALEALARIATLQATANLVLGGLVPWDEIASDKSDCRFCPWRNANKTDPTPRGSAGEPAREAGCIGYHKPRVDLGELGGVAQEDLGDPLLRLIADAQHPQALVALWRDAKERGKWTAAHTDAAAKRKAKLLT